MQVYEADACTRPQGDLKVPCSNARLFTGGAEELDKVFGLDAWREREIKLVDALKNGMKINKNREQDLIYC